MILMGYLHMNSSSVQEFKVERGARNGAEVLNITITTEEEEVKYEIWADTRHPDLTRIESDFNEGLNKAVNEDKDISINEYLDRCYLYIIFPDKKELKQYSANRVSLRNFREEEENKKMLE